eukprot:3889178-Prymnesium_polylepis.1
MRGAICCLVLTVDCSGVRECAWSLTRTRLAGPPPPPPPRLYGFRWRPAYPVSSQRERHGLRVPLGRWRG